MTLREDVPTCGLISDVESYQKIRQPQNPAGSKIKVHFDVSVTPFLNEKDRKQILAGKKQDPEID